MFGGPPEPNLKIGEKAKLFFFSYWRGLVVVFAPMLAALFVFILAGFELSSKSVLCGLVVVVMASFWVTEALHLTVTSFIPMWAFPMLGVLASSPTCLAYFTDTVLMFLASLFLAYAIELSGLHVRLALCAVRLIGYSHKKLLFAMSYITMFVSMWITNTAATTMMVPINFAVLRVLEQQGMGSVYVKGIAGGAESRIPSDITICYFCTATYSATVGGIGTLVGTGTNLAFKGLFETAYPTAPELLTFPLFSAFTIPYMLFLNTANYLWMVYYYFGWLRPNSPKAKAANLPPDGIAAAKKAIDQQWKAIGPMTYFEISVIVLFSSAICLFFCRQPKIFNGWAESLLMSLGTPDEPLDPRSKFIRDSAPAMFVVLLMFLLPSTLDIAKYWSKKFREELPKDSIMSVLDYRRVNSLMPYGFAFLLGGGFALSTAASTTGLAKKLGESLKPLKSLPTPLIILVLIMFSVFVTNFASNVATANVICPVAMELAEVIKLNPLWLCIVCGLSASYCFMLPVGTPGNLIVQSATNMPTKKMIIAGSVPTLSTILISWLFMISYLKVIWNVGGPLPPWAGGVIEVATTTTSVAPT